MSRNPFSSPDYRPQFSGHETFPLRYGWLKKAVDRVIEIEQLDQNRAHCWGPEAIAALGVGKNMVASIRHWAIATGVIVEDGSRSGSASLTDAGNSIFGRGGLDPYMEHPATSWYLHWQIASSPANTTWYWVFNFLNASTFNRDMLIQRLERLAQEYGWRIPSKVTLRHDVACFVRTYSHTPVRGNAPIEDSLESPLTELGLVIPEGKRDGFRLVRGPKQSLTDGVFSYGLLDYWMRSGMTATLSFESIAYAPGSPGRIFLLDENSLAERLVRLDEATGGLVQWSETAGLKQVVRRGKIDEFQALKLFLDDLKDLPDGKAA